MSTLAAAAPTQHTAVRRIALAALAVALFDMLYAYVYFAKILGVLDGLEGVFQSIAAGLLGRASYQGGMRTALLGVVLHLFIATTWSTLFYLLFSHWEGLRRVMRSPAARLAVGAVLGMIIWTFMDLVVLRLSRARSLPVTNPRFYINLAQHALMIGPPIALIIGREDTP